MVATQAEFRLVRLLFTRPEPSVVALSTLCEFWLILFQT